MKKRSIKKGALAGGILLAASLLSGFQPDLPAPVYGPPPETVTPEPTFKAEDNLPQPAYGPPIDEEWHFDPELNEVTGLYGPPPYGHIVIQPQSEAEETPAPEETEAQP